MRSSGVLAANLWHSAAVYLFACIFPLAMFAPGIWVDNQSDLDGLCTFSTLPALCLVFQARASVLDLQS